MSDEDLVSVERSSFGEEVVCGVVLWCAVCDARWTVFWYREQLLKLRISRISLCMTSKKLVQEFEFYLNTYPQQLNLFLVFLNTLVTFDIIQIYEAL